MADDLIVTGGTAEAALRIFRDAGATVIECCFLVELPALGGRDRLSAFGCGMYALIAFEEGR